MFFSHGHISILRARLTEAVRRFQAKEAKMAVLEKKETEIERERNEE